MDLLALLSEAIAAGRPVALATIVDAPGRSELLGRRVLLAAEAVLGAEYESPGVCEAARKALSGARTGTVNVDGLRVYVEPFLPEPHLVVMGAGHVAQPVAQVGKLLGFSVIVIDDRSEFANAARFPTADVVCAEFISALRGLGLGPRHCVVLVTRGHLHDMECLREVLGYDVAYIGMIGSRTRVRSVMEMLVNNHGIDPDRLKQVYAPIGLDIGARTPAEIAVAVGAELVKVRYGGSGASLSRLSRAMIHGE